MTLDTLSPSPATEASTATGFTSEDHSTSIGERLQAETTAVRLKIHWPGVRKTLSQDQTRQAAGTFDADIKSVSASKKLLDTRHPAFRAATAVRKQAADYWKNHTLPYVEPGMRLIRRSDVAAFDVHMTSVQRELAEAVEQLERHYDEMIDQARERLGDLFDPSDYAAELHEQFGIEWDYPSNEPPEYLLRVSPQLYYSECARVQTRFDEAVRLAEQAFADELSQMVSHLAERLSGEADGSPKVFRDSALTNLREFFDRFQHLNIRSDEGLDRLVDDARQIISGVAPQDLRDRTELRQKVASQLTRVEASLDGWMTDRPRRSILRRSR
ncbi:hypothetical protein Pla22_41580 [Rubripirellula amarantea]|uniref:DUF3150 domain-containing protein n=1 Tax=Rubripirellula amarantea TaxID=2527999 RepID=A0A5C5WL25_9BACT|nr:hypothetical protein [Rubripirellula amarantea]TWT51380.1 hypothetical protein Pla22_41580 [Rubripirellula amarantea]